MDEDDEESPRGSGEALPTGVVHQPNGLSHANA